MKDQFVPYELALKLKELGFDEECLTEYMQSPFSPYEWKLQSIISTTHLHKSGQNDPHLMGFTGYRNTGIKHFGLKSISAPLWQQAFDWFEREHFAYSHIYPEFIGSDEWEYAFKIDYLPREKQDLKRRGTSFECIESFELGIGSYTGAWSDKIEARQACLEKLIELCRLNK